LSLKFALFSRFDCEARCNNAIRHSVMQQQQTPVSVFRTHEESHPRL